SRFESDRHENGCLLPECRFLSRFSRSGSVPVPKGGQLHTMEDGVLRATYVRQTAEQLLKKITIS
ncbi:hypothetical protein LXA43DRAFT_896902, partial [Ganoderma leucocontextum]